MSKVKGHVNFFFKHLYLGPQVVTAYASPTSNLTAITFLTCNNPPMGSKVMRTQEFHVLSYCVMVKLWSMSKIFMTTNFMYDM